MLCFLAVVAMRQADPLVSVHYVGSVAAIAKEISRQIPQPVEARGRVADTVLIVDVDQVRTSELLRRISWATYGKVVEDQGRTTLIPDGDAGREAERAYRKATDARNARVLKAVKAEVLAGAFDDRAAQKYLKVQADLEAPPGTITDAEIERRRQALKSQHTPEQRLAANLLTCVPPHDWFESSGGFVAFSTAPRPRMGSFSQGVDRFVSQYAEESTRLAAASQRENGSEPLGKVTLLVAQAGLPRPGNVILRTYGLKGQSLGMSILPLGSYAPIETPAAELLDAIPEGSPTPLSELSQAEIKAWTKRDGVSLRVKLQDPEQFDPQGSLTADVWRAVAKYAKKGLVLNLPDQELVCPPDFIAAMPPLRQTLAKYWVPGTLVEKDCILARPPYPRPEWGWQMPRRALGSLIRGFGKSNDHLAVLADFVHASGYPHYPFDKMAYFYLAGLADADGQMRSIWEFLCFFGGLPRSTQSDWRQGGVVHLQPVLGRSGEDLDRYATSTLAWSTAGGIAPDPYDALPRAVQETWLSCVFQSDMVEIRGKMKDGQEFEYPVPVGRLGSVLKSAAGQIESVMARPSSTCGLVFTAIYPGGLKSVTHFSLPPRPPANYGPIDRLPKEILDRMGF